MMAQKDFETDSKTFWSLLLSSFPKRISSLVSRAQIVLLLLLVRVTKGDDDPERRKRKRRRRAFLCRRRPHHKSAKRFDIVAFFVCEIPIGIFVSKHPILYNRETTYKSARGKDDHQSRRKDHFA